MKSPLSLNTGTVDILLVDLPQDSYDFSISRSELEYKWDTHVKHGRYFILLTPGNYKCLGWSDELTEEQAKGLVQKDEFIIKQTFYMDYQNRKKWLTDALESWHSLLSANNITERKYILVKIKE